MAVTPYALPTVASQSVKGATTWTNLSRIKALDGSGANNGFVVDDAFIERYAHLVIDGVIQTGTNKGGDTTLTGTWEVDYGGSSDTWGETLTPEIVNSPGFGFAFAIGTDDSGGTDMSYYAIGTNYGFNLPSDAVITGIEARASGYDYAAGGGSTGIGVDALQIRVNYTWAPTVEAEGRSSGFVYSTLLQERVAPDKRFRYLIFDSEQNFKGEWRNVINPPSFKREVNNHHSSMMVNLAQNEKSTATAVEPLLTEADENLTTEDDEDLLVELAASIGLGPGTDTEVNNEVEVIAYYGQFEELLTEDDEPLLTEADELIMVEDGAPQGDKIFTGYIPEWELDFGDTDDVSVTLLTHSQELNNIMLETEDVLKVDAGTFNEGYWGLKNFSPDGFLRLCQTFKMVGSVPVNRIRLMARNSFAVLDVPVTLTLTNGTVPGTPGTTLATATTTLPTQPDDILAWHPIDFTFEQVDLTNGTTYEFFIDVPDWASTGVDTYPVQFQSGGTTYTDGILYILIDNTSPTWATGAQDLVFQVYEPGGETTVTYNSMDPSDIYRNIIDFARSRGARVNYTSDSIEDTNTTVSVTLKNNTVDEALSAVLKYCPSDWYDYYDFGENIAHLHQRPSEASRTYTQGRDVVKLKIKRSIMQLINDAYFSGGDTGGGENLYVRTSDFGSISTWRRGLKKINDSRVTQESSATLLNEAEINRYNDAIYSGTLRIIQVKGGFYIEEVEVGELSGFSGFGDLVDVLQLQNMSITYYPEALEIPLNLLLPKVPKRIEDLKRNLDEQAAKDNPTSPTVT